MSTILDGSGTTSEARPATPAPPRATTTATAGAAVVVLSLALFGSVAIGSTGVPIGDLWDSSAAGHPVLAARWERGLVAVAVGAALGLAGALMQGVTRNPLADPGLLGINAGACLAMVLAISLLGVSTLSGHLWFAFAGAAVAAVLVHGIATLGREGATPVKLTIVGAAVTAAATSLTTAVLLVDKATMESYRLWAVGTVGGRGLPVLADGLPFLLVGLVLALVSTRLLDAQALGDDLARALGRRTALDRVAVGAAIVLLAGTATAMAGPITFAGLLVPHAVRTFVGPGHARLLPLSAVGGAILLVLADTVGRVVLPPAEVQVGIMIAVVGAPVFLLLIRRGRAGSP